ncbi:unnamed protein product [Phytomonas sp. Hart1]|nr:unnamed protein product [Phytomonas sp. Hart1]|eukprot:CCW66137.1 unnamed protein product [Phytomonas sp. isolate Hart1]
MMKRCGLGLHKITAVTLQGWGSPSTGGGGGWGDDTSTSKGGWGAPRHASGGGGGWGDDASTSKGGWGAPRHASGGGGGWGDDASTSSRGGWDGTKQWDATDAGWRGAPTGARQSSVRGNFRRGRGPGWGRDAAGGGHDTAGWGRPQGVDEDAWQAAPPSFTPPVRRVDPLTLTAVEVEIDGIKKLVGQRVQVTGLGDGTSWQTLKDHFRQAGEVTFCRLFSNGRAMVEFSTPDDAARAITELQASELEGATLFLREDREDVVLMNTRRKIRDARDAQLRERKEEAERLRREQAIAEGDRPSESLDSESNVLKEAKS